MRVLNLGSINIDHVYQVDHFVRPGETLDSQRYATFAGGKGFNQSIALARAGADVRHVGRVGAEALWLLEALQEAGVATTDVTVGTVVTGHAMIQVVPGGENAIVLFGGANQLISETDVAAALESCVAGDFLLLQNETSSVPLAIEMAHQKGMRIVFNPAPMSAAVLHYPLHRVNLFVLNESEAEALTGKTDPADICASMREKFPAAVTVLTQGSKGATYFDAVSFHHQPAVLVEAVDTTAAGDTFIGFFLAELLQSGDPRMALALGCAAAARCVSRVGAASSIPARDELSTPL